ncbi:MAG: NUDIX domain-containing protein [Clostridia bacterium]|nr:NUDIX domain-containing protein [Clostridia bacterium]
MELWDLYNENRELIGKTMLRGQEVPQGLYHLSVQVWIRNSRGEYLISQRSADRPTFPLMWECVGGAALAGEDSLTAALRETREEVGVELEAEKGRLAYSAVGRVIDGVKIRDILDAWIFEYDGEVDLHNATTAEVAQIKWMNCDEIQVLFEKKKFVHTLAYFFTEIKDKQI